LNQDAKVSVAEITAGNTLAYPLPSGRHAWVHVVEGNVTLNGERLTTGDAAAVRDEPQLSFAAGGERAEVLVFELA